MNEWFDVEADEGGYVRKLEPRGSYVFLFSGVRDHKFYTVITADLTGKARRRGAIRAMLLPEIEVKTDDGSEQQKSA